MLKLLVLLACVTSLMSFNLMMKSQIPQTFQTKISNIINDNLVKGVTIISALATSSSLAEVAYAADEGETIKKKKPKVMETDLGIKYIDVKKGTGSSPYDGDFVVISYSAFLQNGTMFDTTEGKGKKALSFRYGRKQIIPGIESVLETMQVGGERTCTIPPQYAYGSKGVCLDKTNGEQCLVPPDATLNYVIKLKQVGAGYN